MRVLLSAYACEPNRGSEPGNGWNWALHLAKEGHDVLLVTCHRGRKSIEEQLEKIGKALSLKVKYVDVPLWIRPLLRGKFGIFAHYILWQNSSFRAARGMTEVVDIVHHVTWGSIKGGPRLWRLKKPFVFGPIGGGQVTPRGFYSVFGNAWLIEKMRTLLTLKILVLNPFLKLLIRNSSLVLVTNKETLLLVKSMGAKCVEFFLDTGLPESYYPKRFPTRIQKDEFRVLWVGSLYPRKALPIAIEVIRRLTFPVKLTILGDGPMRKKLKSIIDDPIIKNKVEWRGQVPWQEVRKYYIKSDAFLFTSLRDSCPAQLLEAMAFGLPIVTFNHHGARDLVPRSAGIKIKIGSLENTIIRVVQAVEQLYKFPEQREAMGRIGYEFAKKQEWSRKVQLISRYYEYETKRVL
jgi:glycosyltransferase involved in cell wall biosynthesis